MTTASCGTPLNVEDFNRRNTEPREVPFLTSVLEGLPKSSRILDVGCGAASVARFYYERGYTNVQGVELDPSVVEYVRRDLHFPNIVQASGQDLRAFEDDSFDVVYSIHALEHMVDPGSSVREMYRVLKKGGLAMLSVPNGRHLDDLLTQRIQRLYYGKGDHVQCFSDRSFRALLEGCRFRVLRTNYVRGSLTLLLDRRLPAPWFFAKVLYPVASRLYNGVRSFDVLATK